MNSKQGTRYIKNRLGNDLKERILQYNGIISENTNKRKSSIIDCPRCQLVNAIENKYCYKCSYPLKPEAYDEIKVIEEQRIKNLEEQIHMLTKSQKEILECLRYPEKLSLMLKE